MLSRSVLVFAAVTIIVFVVFVFAASGIDVLLLMPVLGATSAMGLVFLMRQSGTQTELSIPFVELRRPNEPNIAVS